jgi:endonuclease/exonuclease/phosphatase (EEP) superfamily protein YafD
MPPSKSRARRVLHRLCAACVLALAALTLGAFLESWTVLFWQFPHFTVYYALAGVGAVAFAAALRAWRWFALAVVCAVVNLQAVVPWFMPQSNSTEGGVPNLRIIVANVQTSNKQVARLKEWVNEVDPDLLLLQEMNHRWLKDLENVRKRFPHRVEQLKPESSGVVLWSRHPLGNIVRGKLAHVKARSVRADVTVAGRRLHLVGLHARPPKDPLRSASRDQQLAAATQIAAAVQTAGDKSLCIVMGDLNTTMWGRGYRHIEEQSGLVNTRKGFGVLPTWSTKRWPLLVPLDHCLCSPEIVTRTCELGPDFGSDHLPLYVELHVPPASSE